MKRCVTRGLRGVSSALALLILVACALHVTHSEIPASPSSADQTALRIATHNVHYIVLGREEGSWSVADWHKRKVALDKSFKAMDADIVAFQEMESFQRGSNGSVNLAREYLRENNPGYGVAASGDWREFPSTQPIFYRSAKLRSVDQGWFFFSDTPDVIYSRTFNGSYPAFASWAVFEQRATGKMFRVVSIHFEYSSRSNRRLSASLVRDRISPWIDAGETVFLVGDLNATFGSTVMEILEESGVAFDKVPGATYHLNRGVHLFGAIDHLARGPGVQLTNGPVVLQREYDGIWPSDHHPVFADYVLP